MTITDCLKVIDDWVQRGFQKDATWTERNCFKATVERSPGWMAVIESNDELKSVDGPVFLKTGWPRVQFCWHRDTIAIPGRTIEEVLRYAAQTILLFNGERQGVEELQPKIAKIR